MDPVSISLIAVPALVSLLALGLVANLVRNRKFTSETEVYHASRWTRGNRLWPTQIAVFPARVVRYTPRLFGHLEETISVDQVASVTVNSSLFFSDIVIETSGGTRPVVCHGHWKKDAVAIRDRITTAQAGRPGGG